jgi:ribonuclease HII
MNFQLLPFFKEGILEAGCDEAGRGCLAGPVVAAAVILPPDFDYGILNDSKLLSEKQRKELRPIIENGALAWAVEMVSNEEIDKVNILNASFLAMNRAVQKLKVKPEHLLIDGNRFRPQSDIPFTCMVKGDGRFYSIAAASVLAKTWRDEYMEKIHPQFPISTGHRIKVMQHYGTGKPLQNMVLPNITVCHSGFITTS